MRAVIVEQFGDPGVLSFTEVPTPEPRPGEVRIDVVAAGVNPVDTYNVKDPTWAGVELGCIPGYDVAGTIDAVGDGVDPALVGRPAMAMTAFPRGQGGYAEQVVVDADLVAVLGSDVDLVAAASVPLAAGTALDVVEKLKDAGASVLVVGGSGGVGLFFCQLAAAAGLRPIALGRASRHAAMMENGAVHCIDYTDPDAASRAADLAGGQFDSIADLAGGSMALAAQPFLRDDGRICAIATPELDIDGLIDHNQSFHGLLIRDNGDRVRRLASLLDAGQLRTHVRHVLPLEAAAEAFQLQDSGEAGGKIVLVTQRP
ncbi:MAG TPA: NADP-dependent oxidoreductase [Actinomycetes bacterium]|nr:NADP-dependent oxidoreductase [Actinomycetes bacterium]